MAFKVTFISLYPDAFPGPLGVSILNRARLERLWDYEIVNLRDFGLGKHRQVDAPPAGGGAGLILRPDVAAAALDSIDRGSRQIIFPSPRGRRFDQSLATEWSTQSGLIFFCGRFEGLDQRVIDARQMQEISLGDFVLAGAESAAMAMLEAVLRLIPGIAGNPESIVDESFSSGLLEYPQYTLPRVWEDHATPDILLSGHHENINAWRNQHSQALTKRRRPDLWAAFRNGPHLRASETDDEPD